MFEGAHEEHTLRLLVVDDVHEGVVADEGARADRPAGAHGDECGGRRRLSTLLVHLQEGFVQCAAQYQVAGLGEAVQVGRRRVEQALEAELGQLLRPAEGGVSG